MAEDAAEKAIRASRLRLRARSPFFGTLLLHARFVPSHDFPFAATNGRTVFYNPEAILTLPPRQVDGLVLHEVLHAALGHCTRRGPREPLRWNVAADVVVNGIVTSLDYAELPPGGIRAQKLEHHAVEEVYALLDPELMEGQSLDLLDGATEEDAAGWRNALARAAAVQRGSGHGDLPGALGRLVDASNRPTLAWRSLLWRFLTRTPVDYSGFDRRFVHMGLYLDQLEGETVKLHVCIDTSGSIDNDMLSAFLGEIDGICRAYPHLDAKLWYADQAVHGPFAFDPRAHPPVGGGGTSFEPFFEALPTEVESGVCVYFTDGYGSFPAARPKRPVIWAVTPGGLESGRFPFGEVVRLVD